MRPPFHLLPPTPAGLSMIELHRRPHILLFPALLSAEECRRLREKAARSLEPQSYDTAQTGRSRTSAGCTLRNDEVPTLRRRFASLAGVALSQLQPLKVSRYRAGEMFDIHTDAVRGDLRGAPPDPHDWWADAARSRNGVPGAPLSGCNRICTIFVYLSTVHRGGRTLWRWTDHDAALGRTLGKTFYDRPQPGPGATDVAGGSGPLVQVAPREGLGVMHFPSTTAASGGLTDYNAYHEAEPPIEPAEKWVAQQFIWSHERLDYARMLEPENHEPSERRSEDTI